MNIRPLQDRIMVQPILEKQVQKGGIIIPDSAKEKPIEGRVKAVGKGKIGDDGKPIKLEIKVGDKVKEGSLIGMIEVTEAIKGDKSEAKAPAKR